MNLSSYQESLADDEVDCSPPETLQQLRKCIGWSHQFYDNITCLSFIKAFSNEVTAKHWKSVFPEIDVKWLETATSTAAVE